MSLSGLRIAITAGPTVEPIDPVRFIGNRSSGKQGHAIAEEAAARGASVTLVTTTDLAATRARLEAHGAIMDPPRDPRRCDGVDPEGNVFQIAAPDP